MYCKSLFIAILLAVTLTAIAQHKKPISEKTPAWVTVNTYDYSKTTLDAEAEDGYIDVAFEEQVAVELQTTYYRKAIKIISEAGIENTSEISLGFDPTFQQLYVHSLVIIRDGKTINKLAINKFEVIQQETELSRSLYNGALTALLILDDVRKGDIIEYSYSLKGFNPIFKGKFAENFSTSYSVPLYWIYYKMVYAKTRTIHIKNIGEQIKPITTTNGNTNSVEWKLNEVHALHIQDRTPAWFDPYSMIMVSEFSSWAALNQWAVALFPKNPAISAGLQKKITEIHDNNPTDETRVLATLRFVQDDVRYMGIEMGEHSHLPNNPNKIFDQRFGDCKDKAYLLCVMLNSMGISADPVLINTAYKKAIFDWLPSYYNFDHCTARVILNNKAYYLDATISYQRGYLQYIAFPDYQVGFVLTDTTTALTPIALQESGQVKAKEVFTIPDMSGKAKLVVNTEYSGSYADDVRSSLRNNSHYEIQKNFLNFYANFYDNISVADSMQIDDDEVNGILVTKEYYNVDKIWQLKNGVKKASFYAYLISSIIQKPKDAPRTMPFRITYPARYKEEITINLPEAWDIEESTTFANCAAFNLKANFTKGKKVVYLDFDYEALKDYADTEEAAAALEAITKFEDEMGYGLTYKDSEMVGDEDTKDNAASSGNIIYTILFITVFVLFIIYRTQKRNE
ncbi:DUF3857 domain-containing transglutaminase family protein [Limnovirga soli]|uniref:DUF3857 domain-containing protein n=1 Tax=Limnovirga soli TaxID=2656915 RepID=A0A8J8FEN3_9BACT|nr:DUF3857 domain-containing transglutaminase family protein [Limnovirga soli]NNV55358.1 DUF3857 domain-containing protein [Limnovirga soli]